MKLKMIVGFLLFLMSFSVFADTYPVISSSYYWSNQPSGYHEASSAQELCNTMASLATYHFVAVNGYCNGYRNSDNGSMGSFGNYNGPVLRNTCPGGGTVSGSNCINAPACVSPQVRDVNTGICVNAPIIACSSGQYAPLGSSSTASCVPVPNCNASSPSDGNYFDIQTAACVTSSGSPMCLTGVSVAGGSVPPQNYYCPPVSDCLPVSQSCTNNAIDVQNASNARAAEIAAIKAVADSKKAQADTESATAAAAKTAKDNVAAASAAAQAVAKAQSDAVAAAPASTPSQILAAAKNYAAAVADYTSAFAKAANSLLAAAAAQTAAGDAMGHANAIPAANPGNGQVLGDSVSNDLGRAIVAAGDAVSGLGSGTGTGQGASSGTCAATNTCPDASGLAKDATLGLTNGKLDGIANDLKKDTAAYSAKPDVRTIGDSFGLVSTKFRSKLPNVNFSNIEPDCPVFTQHIPFINVDLTIDQFCTMDHVIRPTLQVVSLFIYSLMAFLIVLRA